MAVAMWMVRAGEGAYLIEEFEKGYVGVGWSGLKDLGDAKTVAEVKSRYKAAYPDDRPSKLGNAAAMINKFANVFEQGTRVITYNPEKRIYHVDCF
jgi:restriction system protein